MTIYGTPGATPITGIIARFPKQWRTDVVVIRSGGRDAKGNPLPATEIPVPDCVVGPRFSDDPLDRSDATTSTAALYRDNGFTFRSTDLIRVPEGALMEGEWAVDGRPSEWPLGTHVELRA